MIDRILEDVTGERLKGYWQDFELTAFALYDEAEVCLFNHPKCEGKAYIIFPKTEQFCACTLILFENYPTAIVDLSLIHGYEEIYSLVVHELFHRYQYNYGESRFPDEML